MGVRSIATGLPTSEQLACDGPGVDAGSVSEARRVAAPLNAAAKLTGAATGDVLFTTGCW